MGDPETKVTTDEIFILDDWLGVSYAVPNAKKMRRDESTVLQIAELAGRFLSLSGRDQETLSRVAEALQDKPGVGSLTRWGTQKDQDSEVV